MNQANYSGIAFEFSPSSELVGITGPSHISAELADFKL